MAVSITEISVALPPSPGQHCPCACSSGPQRAGVFWLTPEPLMCHCSCGKLQRYSKASTHGSTEERPRDHPAYQHERWQAVPSVATTATGGAHPLNSGVSGRGPPCTRGLSSCRCTGMKGRQHEAASGASCEPPVPSPPAAPRTSPEGPGCSCRFCCHVHPQGPGDKLHIAVPWDPHHPRASGRYPKALLHLSAHCCFSLSGGRHRQDPL